MQQQNARKQHAERIGLYLNVAAKTGAKSCRLPVYNSTEQVSNRSAESRHDGECGQAGGVVLRLTDIEEVGAARRLTGVTAAVQQNDTEDRQRNAVPRQTADRLHLNVK